MYRRRARGQRGKTDRCADRKSSEKEKERERERESLEKYKSKKAENHELDVLY